MGISGSRRVWRATAVLGIAASLVACDLNPQPLPPDGTQTGSGGNGRGSAGGGQVSAAGGAGSSSSGPLSGGSAGGASGLSSAGPSEDAGLAAADASTACVTCWPAAPDATSADGAVTEVSGGDASSDARSDAAGDSARSDGGDGSVAADGARAPGPPDAGDDAVDHCPVASSPSPCEAGGWHDAQRPSGDAAASGPASAEAGDPLGAEPNAP